MSFESLLAEVADEAQRNSLKEVITANPTLKRYLEAGEVAAPVLTKIAAIEGMKPEEELGRLPNWLEYRQQHWLNDRRDQEHPLGMYRSEAAAIDRATAAEAEATAVKAELEALRLEGANMTQEEFNTLLDAKLNEKKFLTHDGLKAEIVQPGGLVNGAFAVQAKQFQNIYAALTPKAVEHAQKFNEALPVEKVFSYMSEKGVQDPVAAYDALMAPKLREMEKADVQRQIEEAEKRGEAKGMQLAAQSRQGSAMPVGGGGVRTGNSFMEKIFGKRAERQGTGVEGRLGDGTAAREGYSKWQQKRAAATQV